MIVLGIETSCDETAVSVVRSGEEILANTVYSQADLHEEFGGVFPEIAARRHADVMIPTLEKALEQAKISLDDIDLIAATKGPGLINALLIGFHAAKTLSIALKKPFVGVNHVEAHLYAALMGKEEEVRFPALGIVLSGGHTFMVRMEGVGSYEMISETHDDAIGEAFDKVAALLNLPYPGGPHVEKLAKKGDPERYPFKGGTVKKDPLAFSFSGLKTSVLYQMRAEKVLPQDIAASFQRAAIEDVRKKALIAKEKFHLCDVILGGGVTQNKALQKAFHKTFEKVHFPKGALFLDNAAMIAGLGYHIFLKEGNHSLNLEAKPRISLV